MTQKVRSSPTTSAAVSSWPWSAAMLTSLGCAADISPPTVVSVRGDLDRDSIPDLRAALGPGVDQQLVVLDLTEVDFIDPAGIGALIGAIRGVHERGGVAIVLTRPGPTPVLLERVGVSRMAPVLMVSDDARSPLGVSGAEHDRGVTMAGTP